MNRCIQAVLLIFLCHNTIAQRNAGSFIPLICQQHNSDGVRDYVDTVKASSFIPASEGGLGCATGLYTAPDSGYVAGNNKYGDLQKAQFYSLHKMGYMAPGILQGVQVFSGTKSTLAGSSQVVIQIYAVDTGGFRPGNIIATSNPVSIQDIDISGMGNTFSFPAAVTVEDSFFVSMVLPATAGDTLAIVSTIDDCSAFTGWSWEQWSDQTWHTLVNSWITDIDLALFPILDLPFNTGLPAANDGNIYGTVFPNPARQQANFHYELTSPAVFSMTLVNAAGIMVSERQIIRYTAGSFDESIDLRQCTAGLYLLKIMEGEHIQIFRIQVL